MSKLYDFQQIKSFNPGPIFPELASKTVGDLNDTQAMHAHEDWIRAQFDHMAKYYRPHLSLLLHIIDKFREELVQTKGPHIARAFARLSIALNLHEAVWTERESLEEALIDIALNRISFLQQEADDLRMQDPRLIPIPMILHCPKCGAKHIDAPDVAKNWSNPPHRSHLCNQCGVIWRPADVPTTGVAAIATRGQADTWTGASNAA